MNAIEINAKSGDPHVIRVDRPLEVGVVQQESSEVRELALIDDRETGVGLIVRSTLISSRTD